MIRRQVIQLVAITTLAVAGLLYTFLAGNAPLLGLDLQGGVSVRLVATEPADEELLDQAVEVIRNRVDGLGVAEPEISRTSNGVLVSLPGVDDTERALDLVGQTAEMRFRPVCAVLPAEPQDEAATTTTLPGDGSTGDDATTTSTIGGGDATTTTEAASEQSSTTVRNLRQTTTTGAPGDGSDAGTGSTTTTTAGPGEGATTTTTAPDGDGAAIPPAEPTCLDALAGTVVPVTDDTGVTPPAQDDPEDFVILPGEENGVPARFLLGPAGLTGDAISDARAQIPSVEWIVNLELKSEGNDAFNELAIVCYGGGSPTCASGRLAITLDGEVLIAPVPQEPGGFEGTVSITGAFTESEAKDLALAIRYGSLPVPLEAQNTEIVSASIGEDALRAGVVSAIIGFVLVALYMLLYYRVLGLVAILSLLVSTALLWTIIAWFGENNGLALTLAGVTGLIVSIGVAVDSNVVYYEHLKEDIRDGRNPRSSVDRAFPSAFSTIVKADVASLIGAALLYFLTVGAVRGFAFYLGLATLLDLVGSYFFMGPAVRLLARHPTFMEHLGWYGLPPEPAKEA